DGIDSSRWIESGTASRPPLSCRSCAAHRPRRGTGGRCPPIATGPPAGTPDSIHTDTRSRRTPMADDYTPDEGHMSVAWVEYDDAAGDINEAEAEFDRF